MNVLFLVLGLVVGLLSTVVVFIVYQRQSKELKQKTEEVIPLKATQETLKSRMEDYLRENNEYKSIVEEKNIEIQNHIRIAEQYKTQALALEEKLNTQKEEITSLREELNKEFKLLANEILEEKTKKFSELNEEKIGNILNPLKEKIQHFEKKVDETYNNETREKASLREELKNIININRQMSEDAQKLTSALKGDSKIQGDWGELQLELLLEKSGLIKGVHFDAQQSFRTDEGNLLRPDYIVNLPENKNFIIDSKVSLTAYERYYNTEDSDEKSLFLKQHLTSVNQHIQDLGSKNYSMIHQINTPDFVFLYFALEPALTLALQHDNTLFDKALNKNIVLVSNSTLLASMRTVSFIWKQENQKQNVVEIAKESGLLYDKFANFTEDLLDLGKSMETSKKNYDLAMNKLVTSTKKGDTIVGRVEKLKTLGANASKSINQALINRVDSNEELLLE